MSLFAKLLKHPDKAPLSRTRPAAFMIPESQKNEMVLANTVMIPESQKNEMVSVKNIMIPESQKNPAALRKSVVPEQDYSLYRSPEDYSATERAIRDQKLEYIRAVWELHLVSGCPEPTACALVAEKRGDDFPLLMTAGKNGTSVMRYCNYRVWVMGSKNKPGLGRLNDGTPDYRNADVLLRNYRIGEKQTLYGDPMFWAELRGLWLRNSDPYLSKNYRHVRMIWESEYPDQKIPSLNQVRIKFKKAFPRRMMIYARKGENYYDQHIRNYIARDPDSIRPGEAWVADTKDCDFMIRVRAPEGSKNEWNVIRPKIVLILDVKSQFPVSVQLIDGNCSNLIIRNAFAQAVYYFGRPRLFLTDNGADYCKAGFGDPVIFTPEVDSSDVYCHSILRELDVEHDKSLPYNAGAKIVERFFREVAGYERDTRGYVGNKPENRPATANVWAKIKAREYLNNTQEACEWITELLAVYLNTPSHGKFLNGLTPIQAFRPELRYTRAKLTEAEYIRAFRIPLQESKILDPRGPSVRVDNARYVVIPEDRERSWAYDGKRVMIKTELLNKKSVYIYDLDGTYIAECRLEDQLPYFDAPAELLSERQKEINAEKVLLRSRIMDATGGWHLVDGQTIYHQPREAFASPAPVKLLETAKSVGGETHNPKVYILKSEAHPEAQKSQKVSTEKTMIPESQKTEKKKETINPELRREFLSTINGDEDHIITRHKVLNINQTEEEEKTNEPASINPY